MGADQSTESKKRDDEKYQRMMTFALEHQRKMYEEKCKELLREKEKTKAALANIEQNVPQNSTLVTQTERNYAPLYPNLQQATTSHPQTSTSSTSNLAHTNSTLTQNNSILHPLQTSETDNVSHLKQNANIVPATSNTFYNNRASKIPFQNKPHPSASFDCQPSAPTDPEPSATSQKKQREDTKNKKNNDPYQCPSCKINSLKGNIFQCLKGHSSCNQCKISAVKCGVCKSLISNTRNIELEHYIANLEIKNNVKNPERVNCPNKSDGCSLSFKPVNLQAHLKECIFRELACPLDSVYTTCVWRGKINQIQAHFLECHPEQTGANVDTEICFDRNKNQYVIHHVVMGKFNFLIHVRLDSKLQTFFMAVQLIGSLMSASKWSYEFHVYDKNEPRRKFTYVDSCLPTTIPFSDVSKESKCAALPLQYALSFFKDNKVTYKFYIKRDEIRKSPNQRTAWHKARSVQSET